ncbi:AraC family transcriptional regulator [Alteromonas sp. a30]|uniref:AraC family transcriptional regulator n=1 Tax=Alteromonas sp. a30 TaxID=2730917 RepID=UPI002282C482|nr:AraC family transcriptional regulator [Alteromonas sp. a30]MCY7295531.1 helix-turn-helix domain-containing protein [Alteromonas sp. a30]
MTQLPLVKHSIHPKALALLLAGYQQKGHSVPALLASVGEPTDFFQRENTRLPSHKLGKVFLQIIHQLNDETLGFLTRSTPRGSMDLGLTAAMGTRSLQGAIKRLAAFFHLIHEDMTFELIETDKEAQLKVHLSAAAPATQNPNLFIIIMMLFLVRWMSWLVNQQVMINQITLQMQKPVFAGDMDSIFPCSHFFSQSHNCIIFNKDFLLLPLERKLTDVKGFIATLPDLLTRRFIDSNLTGQIKRMLKSKDNIASLSLKTIAEELNKSPQTLRRRLKQEGGTFAEIKENVRRDIAIYHLTHEDMPIKNIAYRVGFSEPSAFIRAFKNWTGSTPGEYRGAFKAKPNT